MPLTWTLEVLVLQRLALMSMLEVLVPPTDATGVDACGAGAPAVSEAHSAVARSVSERSDSILDAVVGMLCVLAEGASVSVACTEVVLTMSMSDGVSKPVGCRSRVRVCRRRIVALVMKVRRLKSLLSSQ